MQKSIRTEIVINASKERVWNVLTDFSSFPVWNPFIVSVEGELVKGKKLKNTLINGNSKMVFRPVILDVKPFHSFSWLGNLFVKGLFDGKHSFTIEPIGNNQIRLIHEETFSGLLSGWILNKIGRETRINFIRMNEALRARAEAMSENLSVA